MKTTKFHELCGAYEQAQNNFDAYKTDCHIFSMELVKELKSYLEIPESQFSLYKISEERGFELVTPALIHAIRLTDDHYWHFGIGITVCKAMETLPEELILIHLMFRENDQGAFFVRYAPVEKEFEINKGAPETYIPFFDFIFETIKNSYKEHIQQFVGEKTVRKLGYRQ
jgi:hypothetical protein